MTKNPIFFNFRSFYAFFVKVSTDFVDLNVLKGQQGKTGCAVVFIEEIIAMFWMKMPQNDTENDKSPQISQFSAFFALSENFLTNFVEWNVWNGRKRSLLQFSQRQCFKLTPNMRKNQNFQFSKFPCIFVQVLTDFLDWNVLKGQQGEHWLSSSLYWRDICNVLNENITNWHRKRQKSQIFPIFKILFIFLKILTDFVDWNVEKGQQGKNLLSSVLRKEINAVV